MKIYGSTTGTARQIRDFYGAVDHKARLAYKVYGPVDMPDYFDTLTIQSGGVGNITGTNPATFTTHIKESDTAFWEHIVIGEYIPLRIESVRSGSSFLRQCKLTFVYRLSGSSSESTYSLLSYSSDSSYKSGLERYGFSYKSSLSNGTDVINFTMGNAPKTKLIHKGFANTDWGEVTYYTGFTTRKSIVNGQGTTGVNIIDIDYDTFESFLTANDIDTTKTVEYKTSGMLLTAKWYFYKSNNASVTVDNDDLTSTTGLTRTPIVMSTPSYFNIVDAQVVNPSSATVTKKLRDGVEFASLCADGFGNGSYTIDGVSVPAGSIASFKCGINPGEIGDYFLANCKYLTTVDFKKWQIGNIGNCFLLGCTELINGDVPIPKDVVSIGDNFMRGCSKYNQVVTFTTDSKCKTIGSFFMAYCPMFNEGGTNNYLRVPAQTIGNRFLSNDTAYSKSVYISNAVTIGTYFLAECTSFNSYFAIPSTLTSLGVGFMYKMGANLGAVSCGADASIISGSNAASTVLTAVSDSVPAYTTGIQITGTYKDSWRNAFPDSTSSPYRKLRVL